MLFGNESEAFKLLLIVLTDVASFTIIQSRLLTREHWIYHSYVTLAFLHNTVSIIASREHR
jgi:hypothetical protein